MANILLTNKCVRSCPYCFAEKEMAGSKSMDVMSWENVIYIADFLHTSGERHVSLLGGEPTIHPDFTDIVLYFIARNFNVTVFTSAIMSGTRLDELEKHLTDIPTERLTFVCNLNNPEQTPSSHEETEKIERFLSVMGPWTMPGFNIYRLDFELGFLVDLINRYGLKRSLRLGLAHPIPNLKNAFISTQDIGKVIERLYSHKPLFDRFRVSPGLDCGFPICKLTDEHLGWISRLTGRAQFGCGPAIDITPDMQVYSCFPLSSFHKKSLFEFDSLKQVVDYYNNLHTQVRSEVPGIYAECDNCVYKDEDRCAGGGICQILNRFTAEAPIRLPDIENGLR